MCCVYMLGFVCSYWVLYVHFGFCMFILGFVFSFWVLYVHVGFCIFILCFVCSCWVLHVHYGFCMFMLGSVCRDFLETTEFSLFLLSLYNLLDTGLSISVSVHFVFLVQMLIHVCRLHVGVWASGRSSLALYIWFSFRFHMVSFS